MTADGESLRGTDMSCMRHDRHFSALVFACFRNQFECFKTLYEHGKEHSKDSNEDFLTQWLGGKNERNECLFYAASNKNVDFLSYLMYEVGLKTDLDVKNEDGDNLLHIAAKNGDDRMIYLLCEHAPDVDQPNRYGESALHIAARNGHDSSVRFLLSFDASVAVLNSQKETPLFSAVRAQSVRCVKDLLIKGANRNTKNQKDQRPVDLLSEMLFESSKVNNSNDSSE
jgi:ankyrin repeat protein